MLTYITRQGEQKVRQLYAARSTFKRRRNPSPLSTFRVEEKREKEKEHLKGMK